MPELASHSLDHLARHLQVQIASFRAGWPTLSLFYGAVINPNLPLGGKSSQPSKWVHRDEVWESVFPDDRERIRAYVLRPAAGHVVQAH
jgi:8-oxo-dGTP diphosphatase